LKLGVTEDRKMIHIRLRVGNELFESLGYLSNIGMPPVHPADTP
jgi:hypothetical protein